MLRGCCKRGYSWSIPFIKKAKVGENTVWFLTFAAHKTIINMSNRTFTMIKPDAVAKGHTGKIIDHVIQKGYKLVAMKYTRLSEEKAGEFYAIHRERPFFKDLISSSIFSIFSISFSILFSDTSFSISCSNLDSACSS
jgi:hypothetical protein